MSPESQSRVSFQIEERQEGRKTDLWRVWDLHKARYLGEISWIKTGHRYGFHQTSIATIDSDSLRELATFCDLETRRRFIGRRAFAQ